MFLLFANPKYLFTGAPDLCAPVAGWQPLLLMGQTRDRPGTWDLVYIRIVTLQIQFDL